MRYRFWMAVVAIGITGCAAPRQADYSYMEDGRLRMGNTPGAAVPETTLKNCVPATDIGPGFKDGKMPTYPKSMIRHWITGVVIYRFEVTAEGSVSNIKIMQADHPDIAKQTEQAVSRWKFEPALHEGKPVSVVCTQKATFDIN